MINDLASKYNIKTIVLDTGYGTPEILAKLKEFEISPIVKAVKNKISKKKITDKSFEISENEDYLVCPEDQRLDFVRMTQAGNHTFKANHCELCELKKECSPKSKVKSVTINLHELKLLKEAKRMVESEIGEELYSHRGNKCEPLNGFIKYNLNGKKFKMKGLVRNNTNIKFYAILYNLTRLISIKTQK